MRGAVAAKVKAELDVVIVGAVLVPNLVAVGIQRGQVYGAVLAVVRVDAVDRALGHDPEAKDHALVEHALVVPLDLFDVLGVERGVIIQQERIHAEVDRLRGLGAVDVVLVEPVHGRVGVRGGDQLRAGGRQTGKQLGKEVLGKQGQLVAVGSIQCQASNLVLGPHIVASLEIDRPPE